MYKCIDLFSGAGGLSLGFKRTSYFSIEASIEKIPIFNKTHTENFPSTKSICEDICNLTPEAFSEQTGLKKGDIDVIIGSPPCQTFSTIGIPKIKSLRNNDIDTDPRNYLFKQFFDYVEYYNPTMFLMENVPTMKTRYKGKLFERVLNQIEKLGYTPHIDILNSAEYGVPQTRKRLIVVGTKKGIKYTFPEKTHYIAEGSTQINKPNNLKINTTVFDALNDLPDIYDGCREDSLPYSQNDNLTEYQILLRNPHQSVRNNICRVSNDRAKAVFKHMSQGSKYMDLPKTIREILPFREDIFHDRLKRLNLTKPSWTVLAHIGMDGYMYIHPTENRTLSVREASRLQSFHDSFIFYGNMREQYVQVGNAVPPLLASALANSIKKALG